MDDAPAVSDDIKGRCGYHDMCVSQGFRGEDGQLTWYCVRHAADAPIPVSLHPEQNNVRMKPNQSLDHTIRTCVWSTQNSQI